MTEPKLIDCAYCEYINSLAEKLVKLTDEVNHLKHLLYISNVPLYDPEEETEWEFEEFADDDSVGEEWG